MLPKLEAEQEEETEQKEAEKEEEAKQEEAEEVVAGDWEGTPEKTDHLEHLPWATSVEVVDEPVGGNICGFAASEW